MHSTLPPVVWVLATLGMALGAGFAVAIRWDIHLAESGRQTISEFLLHLGYHATIVVVAIVVAFCLLFGGLAGHLWWPSTARHQIWPIVMATIVICFPVGMWIGHRYFGQ